MCSRYNLTSPPDVIRAFFGLSEIEAFPPRYNIAPGQPVPIVRRDSTGHAEFRLVRWGLLPGWVRDPQRVSLLINARVETAAEKPSFRGAMRHRRCLVPANGFYEWRGPARFRTPYVFQPRMGGPMALAGLHEHWLGADGSELETMAILTVPANAVVRPVHDRMPLILSPAQFPRWLDCTAGDGKAATEVIAEALAEPSVPPLEGLEVHHGLAEVTAEGAHLLLAESPRLL